VTALDPYVFIGLIGSVASIVSLALAAPTAKSRILHIGYAVLLTLIVGLSVKKITEVDRERRAAQSKIERLESISQQAASILGSSESITTVGEKRGFFLIGFAFLEKNKADFPETYSIAKELAMKGIRISESAGAPASLGYYDEQKRIDDGANAMTAILKGIAGDKRR